MAKFIMTYLGGEPPKTQEDGKKHFAEYQQWLKSLGEAVISPANPFKATHTVTPDGKVYAGNQSGLSGFTVVEAEDIDAALAMAKTCPFLKINGTLEVSELVQMSM